MPTRSGNSKRSRSASRCPTPRRTAARSGTRPLYRLWNREPDGAPNHRYTTSTLTFDEMIGQGWVFEGEKETRVFACVPN